MAMEWMADQTQIAQTRMADQTRQKTMLQIVVQTVKPPVDVIAAGWRTDRSLTYLAAQM